MNADVPAQGLQGFLDARRWLLDHRTDLASACAGFRWPRLEHFNWALDYFDPMARDNAAAALWIVDAAGQDERVSFAELARRSSQVAMWLRAQGIQRGDRVLLMLGNERALWESMLALMKLGAVIVPATAQLTPQDLADRFSRGEVRHVICAAGQRDKFDAIGGDYTRIVVGHAAPGWRPFDEASTAPAEFIPLGQTQASDPLLLYFTSGTTSQPKLVAHSHESYPVGHLSTMYWLGLRPGDLHLNISSPGWAKHAWSTVFAPWNAGAGVLVLNHPRFSAEAVLEVLRSRPVSSLCAPPTVWRMLLRAGLGARPTALADVMSAGEPLQAELLASVREAWGLCLRDGYGQTETTCQIGNPPGRTAQPGCMGWPLPGYRVELLDANDRPAQEGEISLPLDAPLPPLMLGYAHEPERNGQAMRAGHYRTGDLARRDADGGFYYLSRADDVFKSSDYRISPPELEAVLLQHPAVAEVAVVPYPDDTRLAYPKAYVSLNPGWEAGAALAQALMAFGRERLAPFKRVRRVEFAPLPRTISGKVQRGLLRARELGRAACGERATGEFREEDAALD